MAATRINDLYLPVAVIPTNVEISSELSESLKGADIVLGVMPSHLARGVYERIRPFINDHMTFVSATKGLENKTLLRVSEVAREVLEVPSVGVISGPSFAKEVARAEPTAVVAASADSGIAAKVQAAFSGPTFRVYTSPDPIGVEMAAPLKM